MTPEQQMEQFSYANVRAVAAAARVNMERPEVDTDSVDFRFSIKSAIGQIQAPILDAQVKCTAKALGRDKAIRFPLKAQILKALPGKKPVKAIERAVRDLVDNSVETEGVVDIFKAAGLEKADLSILDDKFLQTFKDQPLPNLRLKLLEKLIRDEIQLRKKKNLARAKSFQELLENTLQQYHNCLIDAAAVVKALLQIRKDMESDDQRARDLNLAAEEVAFYDAVAENYGNLYDQAFLRDLVHEVVKTIKKNVKVDGTEPHREDVKAAVTAAVKRVRRRRGVREEDFDMVLDRIMEQAEAKNAEWPVAA